MKTIRLLLIGCALLGTASYISAEEGVNVRVSARGQFSTCKMCPDTLKVKIGSRVFDKIQIKSNQRMSVSDELLVKKGEKISFFPYSSGYTTAELSENPNWKDCGAVPDLTNKEALQLQISEGRDEYTCKPAAH